ncbi:hypothetical protein YC2023_025142 [Brassica napus]
MSIMFDSIDKTTITQADRQDSDISTQSAPRNIVETKSVAYSNLKWTATQYNKTVIDMDEHFHLMFGRKMLLNKERVDKVVRFTKTKDARCERQLLAR